MFKKKRPLALGIDIGTSSIKVMEMTESRDRYKIERFVVEPIPRNIVVENAIIDLDRVSRAVRSAVKKTGSKRKHVVVAIAAAQSISKILSLPAGLSGTELEQQIELEAEHYVPFPLADTNLDFQLLGPNAENPSNDDVLFSACRREIVEERVTVLEAAGLTPLIVDVTSFANERALELVATTLPNGGVEKVVAIIDYGATSSHLYVVHQEKLIFQRDFPFGGKSLTESIQRRFGVSYTEAENKKRGGRSLPENYRQDILAPFISAMAQEANRAIQLFVSSSNHDQVDYLFLTGGCSALPKVVDEVADKTGVSTRLANPFVNTKLASSIAKDRLYRYAPLLNTVCGLAMRGAKR